jgi:hypothetical protein
MVKVEIKGKEYYYDGYLVQNLELLKKAVKKKWDGVIYVGGYEGDGKSEMAEQMAFFFDHDYDISRCVFTPEQFMSAVDEAEPFQAIVYDEAQDAFESTNRDSLAKAVKSKMTRIRKKQLFILIVAPDFWRINKYLFIHRSRAFIRVYAEELERGYFAFYNRQRKHKLYIEGKRKEELCVPPNFVGRYTHWRVLDEAEYEAKKDKATESINKDESKPQISTKDQVTYTMKVLNWLAKNNWIKSGGLKALASAMGISEPTLYRYRKETDSKVVIKAYIEESDLQYNDMLHTSNLTGENNEKC